MGKVLRKIYGHINSFIHFTIWFYDHVLIHIQVL